MTQAQVRNLADYTWQLLSQTFGKPKSKRPPVYLFLSPESKGSLKNRGPIERRFVHEQQNRGGGVVLSRPDIAWVSHLDQVPEETGHLFALAHGKRADGPESLYFYCLHEAFGHFSECLVFGSAARPAPKAALRASENSLRAWNWIHEEGRRIGKLWIQAYFAEEISTKPLKSWIHDDWDYRCYQRLARLLRE